MDEADRILDELQAFATDDAAALEDLASAIVEAAARDGDTPHDPDAIWAKIDRALEDE